MSEAWAAHSGPDHRPAEGRMQAPPIGKLTRPAYRSSSLRGSSQVPEGSALPSRDSYEYTVLERFPPGIRRRTTGKERSLSGSSSVHCTEALPSGACADPLRDLQLHRRDQLFPGGVGRFPVVLLEISVYCSESLLYRTGSRLYCAASPWTAQLPGRTCRHPH